MKTYSIAHITDLMNVPPEHLEECLRDIAAAIASLHLVGAGLEATGAEKKPWSEMCPRIDFQPDGKREITPTVNGTPLFTITITEDKESAK